MKLSFPFKLHSNLTMKIFNREIPIKGRSNGNQIRYYDIPFTELEAIYTHLKGSFSFSLYSEKNSLFIVNSRNKIKYLLNRYPRIERIRI